MEKITSCTWGGTVNVPVIKPVDPYFNVRLIYIRVVVTRTAKLRTEAEKMLKRKSVLDKRKNNFSYLNKLPFDYREASSGL